MKIYIPYPFYLLSTLAIKVVKNTISKLLITIFLIMSMTPAFAQKRIALVIGNSHYKLANLANTIENAQALSQKLSNLGFDVTFLKDADKNKFKQAIYTWGKKLQKEDIGLFYYAGHGTQINGENYLIPLDADIKTEYETPDAAIALNSILREVENTKNATNIIIINANQKVPFSTSFQPKNRGLRRVNAPVGTTLVYPISSNKEFPDKNGQNEVFTSLLVKHIETPGLSFKQLMSLIKITIKQKTQGAQIPWYSNSLANNFYFIDTNQNKDTEIESLAWQQAKQKNTLLGYEEYLTQHPRGQYKINALTFIQHLLGINKGWELMEKADYLYFQRHKPSHAFRMYQLAAQQGNVFAMASLAKLWKSGHGTLVDIEKARDWREKSHHKIKQWAEMGHIISQYQLGSLYYEVDENHQLAEKWFRKAAEQGHAAAQSHLGKMYFKGESVEQSYSRAFELFSKASTQGDEMGQTLLKKIHKMKPSVKISNTLASKQFSTNIAHLEKTPPSQHADHSYKKNALQPLPPKPNEKSGNTKKLDKNKKTITSTPQLKILQPLDKKTQALLDSIDLSGVIGVTIDINSVSLIQQQAKKGNAQAQNILGFMYSIGQSVTQSNEQALLWFHKAAIQGNTLAQNNLGYLYLSGKGINQNHVRALSWFYKAAEKNNAQAQNNLGYLYSNGKGVPKNNKAAAEWYRKAALQGDVQAQLNLAFMYSKGKGLKKSDKNTVLWYRKAAEQGHAQAQFNLGWIYHLGTGTRQDDKKAIIWLLRSAEQGFAQAQNNLGWMYKNAKGVVQNDSKSLFWYQKSARQGYLIAQNYLIDNGEDW